MTDVANPSMRALSRVALLLAALGAVGVAAALAPVLGAAPLFEPKLMWLVSAAAVGLVVLGLSGATGAWAFGLLGAGLVWGGAGQLWLTQPLWFPALRLRPEGVIDLAAGALIALEAAILFGALARLGLAPRIARGLAHFGPGRAALILALSILVSVTPMGFAHGGGHWGAYGLRLGLNAALIGLDALVVAALLCVPPPAFTPRIPSVAAAALVALAGSAAFAVFGFDRLPHVEDETAYLMQARLFAAGALSAPAPPEALWPGLDYYLIEVRDGRWLPTTTPGWPAFLAIGVATGAPWLVNPVLAGLTILVAGALATRIWGGAAGALTALLLAVSPWHLALGGSLMPHTASLFLVLSSWLLLLKARDGGGAWLALVAGLAMGWLFDIRQLEGVIVGGLTGLWLLALVREPGGFLRGALYALGCVAAGLAYLVTNARLTGDPLLSPLQRYIDDTWGSGGNAYGFGAGIGPPGQWSGLDLAPGHGPFEAVMNLGQSLALIDMDLFGWGIGSLALVWIAAALGRIDRAALAQLGVVAAIAAALFFYWFSGAFYIGARYWALALFPLAAISALGYLALRDRLVAAGVPAAAPAATLALLCLFSLAVFAPWRMVEKYRDYGDATPLVRAAGIEGDALVFVDPELGEFGSALFLNDPFLRPGRPIYLRDLDPATNAAAAAAFPDRRVVRLPPPGE